MPDRAGSRVTSTSPRLGRFGAEFVRDPDAAVSALLADVAAARGPVIEDVAGAPDALVTLVRQLEDTAIGLPGAAAGTTMVSSARRFHDALRDAGADVAGLLEYPSGHGDVHRARGGRAGADRAAHASGSVGRSRRMKSR